MPRLHVVLAFKLRLNFVNFMLCWWKELENLSSSKLHKSLPYQLLIPIDSLCFTGCNGYGFLCPLYSLSHFDVLILSEVKHFHGDHFQVDTACDFYLDVVNLSLHKTTTDLLYTTPLNFFHGSLWCYLDIIKKLCIS